SSRVFALVIGINEYSKLRPLTGAVADAKEIFNFLTIDLNVPSSHIIYLWDESANRNAIIQALKSLKTNEMIHPGDPIFIYYAGHGGLKKASNEWRKKYTAEEIQVIFPCDYNTHILGSESKEVVNCIPDQTIAVLLNELASAKGDNVTVVFDSCHSASGDRCTNGDDGTGQISRSADVEIEIPTNIDADILSYKLSHELDTCSRCPEPLLNTNQSSHIFYAACGSAEKAWEQEGRGVFTVALLKTIRKSGVDRITYRNLMTSLPILPKQSPHCYGVHKSRILFNSRAQPRRIMFIPVTVNNDLIMTLNAGKSSGVTPGSIWELHASATEDSRALGCFGIRTLDISCATLLSEDDSMQAHLIDAAKTESGPRLYARRVRSGTGNELRVYFSLEAKKIIFPSCEEDSGKTGAIGTCHPEIGYPEEPPSSNGPSSEPEVMFVLCHAQAEKYKVSRMRFRKPARREEVEPVLFAAARWNWHLHRTNGSEKPSRMVSMEVMKLGWVRGDCIIPADEPLAILSKEGVVDLAVRDEDRYGLRISSAVSVPLYIQVFYFDMMDFSISMSFDPHTFRKLDPEILAHGEFMVGDGREGGNSLIFKVTPGVHLEVGFMKLFWSTDQLQLDDLEQDLVFDSESVAPRTVFKDTVCVRGDWGTVVTTLVQHE
ncbi:hypothetical protein BDV93DRAFT_572816, partial [Ceratobasidium sp. AG-I]